MKYYLLILSVLICSCSPKTDEVVNTENDTEASAEESAASIEEETVPAEAPVTKSEEAPSATEVTVEVSESELIEMVGYQTAQIGRIPALKLNDSEIAALAAGLLSGLKDEKKFESISQQSIKEAFSQAQARGKALEAESEEVPSISEDALQIIGIVISEQFGLVHLGFDAEDADLIKNGFIAGAHVNDPDPSMQEKLPAFQEFMQKRVASAQEKLAVEAEAVAAERIAAGKAFFEKLTEDADIQKSESGLHYKIIEPGADEKPTLEDSVLVHYKGTLTNGAKFDSSYDRGSPAKFPLNGVVPGFGEGLTKIGAGGKIILYIPSDLGYGNTPRPGGPIKPGDTLIFECELIEVNPE